MIDEWVKKMCYTYTMKYYLAIKMNKIILLAGKLMDVEIIVSEISQIEKDK
jgi:hypothetical protein